MVWAARDGGGAGGVRCRATRVPVPGGLPHNPTHDTTVATSLICRQGGLGWCWCCCRCHSCPAATTRWRTRGRRGCIRDSTTVARPGTIDRCSGTRDYGGAICITIVISSHNAPSSPVADASGGLAARRPAGWLPAACFLAAGAAAPLDFTRASYCCCRGVAHGAALVARHVVRGSRAG